MQPNQGLTALRAVYTTRPPTRSNPEQPGARTAGLGGGGGPVGLLEAAGGLGDVAFRRDRGHAGVVRTIAVSRPSAAFAKPLQRPRLQPTRAAGP
jgi:hypothetical protein